MRRERGIETVIQRSPELMRWCGVRYIGSVWGANSCGDPQEGVRKMRPKFGGDRPEFGPDRPPSSELDGMWSNRHHFDAAGPNSGLKWCRRLRCSSKSEPSEAGPRAEICPTPLRASGPCFRRHGRPSKELFESRTPRHTQELRRHSDIDTLRCWHNHSLRTPERLPQGRVKCGTTLHTTHWAECGTSLHTTQRAV